MIIQIATCRGKTSRQYHADSPAELIRQVQAQIRVADERHSNQRIVDHHADCLLAQINVQINQFTQGCPDSLFITGLTMVEQVLKRWFVTVCVIQNRSCFIQSTDIQPDNNRFRLVIAVATHAFSPASVRRDHPGTPLFGIRLPTLNEQTPCQVPRHDRARPGQSPRRAYH